MKAAVMPIDGEWADYSAQSGHRMLSDNRELYIEMSRMTVNGVVPTANEARSHMPCDNEGFEHGR